MCAAWWGSSPGEGCWLRSQHNEAPRLLVIEGHELSLSGPALLDLMRAVLARGVPFRFCARGWSMEPFIRDGDVITVSPLASAVPGVGEVVAFVRPEGGNLVVHRVVSRRGAAPQIRGDDSLDEIDGIIPAENLLGRVTRIERHGHAVWLGLGPERYLIAWLSRARLLVPLRVWMSTWLKPLLRRLR
jgi:hypothetical protein